MKSRNYLRVRGEYYTSLRISSKNSELPPRTRRILYPCALSRQRLGTTSAYAENTTAHPATPATLRNYLRVRGEYPPQQPPGQYKRELPPRTRRIPNSSASLTESSGTTSAYAENTPRRVDGFPLPRNYLRVRGEYQPDFEEFGPLAELPPRTRRIRNDCGLFPRGFGTTSAYAENTHHNP